MKRTLFLLAPVFLVLIIYGYCAGYRKTREQPIVYTAPGAEAVEVTKDLVYLRRKDDDLTFDVYRPPAADRGSEPLPAVVFVHGDGPASVIEDFKDWGQLTSWARDTAATGLAAVTFNHSSTELLAQIHPVAEEVDLLLAHLRDHAGELGIDPDRICLWTCSSGPPFALRTVLREKPPYVRCIAVYYGAMSFAAFPEMHTRKVPAEVSAEFDLARYLSDHPEQVPPLLLAQAALDTPALNRTLTHFADTARQLGIPIELLVHDSGEHAFDLGSDTERSREIIRRTLEFFHQHLDAPAPGAPAPETQQEPEPGAEAPDPGS